MVIHKKLIFYGNTKDTTILLILVEHYTTKTDIIRYNLSPNSTASKLCNQNRNILLSKN